MDKQTIERYQQDASQFIDNYKSVKPRRVYELIATFFHSKKLTLDIGCGSGRDLAYLSGSGFIVEGMDPVPAFVEHCRNFLTNVPIYQDALPKLETQKENNKYSNLLLCAVLMHVPAEHLNESIFNILRITAPGGRIFISIRKSRPEQSEIQDRESDERLFNYVQPDFLIQNFEQMGAQLLFHEVQTESARSGIVWDNFVFEKNISKNKILKLNTQLVFSKDIKASVDFYSKCLGCSPVEQEKNFASFKIGKSYLNFHPADNKSPESTGGSVGYWMVEDLLNSIIPFLENGAALYRGPLAINEYFGICQLQDPLGQVIGFEGPCKKLHLDIFNLETENMRPILKKAGIDHEPQKLILGLNKPYINLTIYKEGQLMALCRYLVEDQKALVGSIQLHRPEINKGLLHPLLKLIKKSFKENHINQVESVVQKSNLLSINFHRRLGFKVINEYEKAIRFSLAL